MKLQGNKHVMFSRKQTTSKHMLSCIFFHLVPIFTPPNGSESRSIDQIISKFHSENDTALYIPLIGDCRERSDGPAGQESDRCRS